MRPSLFVYILVCMLACLRGLKKPKVSFALFQIISMTNITLVQPVTESALLYRIDYKFSFHLFN